MKFEFQNWTLIQQAEEPDRQFDHLWGTLTVTGTPSGYRWAMLVQAGRHFDKWLLSPVEGGVGIALTKEMLAADGQYHMQLEATSLADGQTVRHSNVIQVYVPWSLSGDTRWPVLPREFTLAEERIRELNNHPPIPGPSGYWQVWDFDSHSYVNSNFPLPTPIKGDKGDPGDVSTVNQKSPDSNGNVQLAAGDIGALPTSGGTMHGGIDMDGSRISGVATPTEDNDAINKAYGDQEYGKAMVKMTAGESISVSDSAEAPLNGLKMFGNTTQSGMPTPENPVPLVNAGDGGSIGVTVCGKNLCNQNVYVAGLNKGLGTLSPNAPVTSPVTRSAWGGVGIVVPVDPNTAYAVSTDVTPNNYFTITFYRNQETNNIANAISCVEKISTGSASFTTPDGCKFAVITAVSKVAAEFTWSYWQVEKGPAVTSFEPYKGGTLTVSTPNGLPGIPVDSGGNYTDGNGQQWICDEIDFARGVAVQRIGKIDSYNGENVGSVYMSSTGGLDTGATVIYPLVQSPDTDLPAETLAQYAAMRTQCPNTTIHNDAGAWMEMEYVTDSMESDFVLFYVDRLHPVGSIYLSTAEMSPASFLGGTWEQLKDVFPLAVYAWKRTA